MRLPPDPLDLGDVLVAQGNLDEALKSYRDSLAIVERLAASDRSNSGWQRDLTVSHNRVGDVLVAQGKLDEALKSYRDSLAIVERLATSDRSNSGWQRDLAVSYSKIAAVLRKLGRKSAGVALIVLGLVLFTGVRQILFPPDVLGKASVDQNDPPREEATAHNHPNRSVPVVAS